MKKFLNFLLILTLVGGAIGSATFLPTWSAAASEGTGNEETSGVVKNYYDPMFQLVMVRPEDGSIDFAMNSEGTNLYLHRVVLAYYNYEDGVTEAEADAKIAELGAGEVSWGTVVYDFAQNGFPQNSVYGGSAMELGENGEMLGSLSLAEVNKADVLYYAAEFGEKNGSGVQTSWSNMTWVRGKMDYRDCIHGSNYTNYGECKIVRGEGNETVDYWTYGREPAVGVHILSWDEEWQEIQRQRLGGIDAKIESWEALEDFSKVEESEVTEVEGRLAKLKVTLAKTGGGGVEKLRIWRDDLERRLRELQGVEDIAGGGNQGNENEQESQENQENQENNETAKVTVSSGNVLTGIRGGVENGSFDNGDMNSISGANDGDKVDGAGGAEAEDALSKNLEGQGENVEVPNLGGVERKMNLWVVWLPLFAGLLLIILLVSRKIWRRLRDSREDKRIM